MTAAIRAIDPTHLDVPMLAEILTNSFRYLLKHETRLFVADSHEVAICGRWQNYLAGLFETRKGSLRVDIEYNRDRYDPKRSCFWAEFMKRKYKTTRPATKITPDLIIHERIRRGRNFLAVEVKKDTCGKRARIHAMCKCFDYVSPPYNYRMALYLCIGRRGSHPITRALVLTPEALSSEREERDIYAEDLLLFYRDGIAPRHSLDEIIDYFFTEIRINL